MMKENSPWGSAPPTKMETIGSVKSSQKAWDAGNLPVGGIDALQSIRLAVDMLDALIKTRPAAEAYGITGRF